MYQSDRPYGTSRRAPLSSQAGLKLNPDKVEIGKDKVSYVGHLPTHHDIKPNPERVHAVVNVPQTRNKQEIVRFLKMNTYVNKFILHLSDIYASLHELSKDDVPFSWNAKASTN